MIGRMLEGQGWRKQTDKGGRETYAHPDHAGHVIHVNKDEWEHEAPNGRKVRRGLTVRQLASHMVGHFGLAVNRFDENDVHSVLIKHGYKKHKAIVGRYYKGDHVVNLDHTGRNWKHKDHSTGGMGLSGSGGKELDDHLKHMHGSQHSERPSLQFAETMPDKDTGNIHVQYAPASISPPIQFHEDVEQFSSSESERVVPHQKHLEEHGWEQHTYHANSKSGPVMEYRHPDYKGHHVRVNFRNSQWRHYGVQNDAFGKDHDSLAKHLKAFHG